MSSVHGGGDPSQAGGFGPIHADLSGIKKEKGIFNIFKKAKGNLSFSDPSGSKMDVAAKKLGEIKKHAEGGTKPARISKGVVHLNVQDTQTGKWVRVGVKVKDLAPLLGMEQSELKEAVENQHIDQKIQNKLVEQFTKNRMELPQNPRSSPQVPPKPSKISQPPSPQVQTPPKPPPKLSRPLSKPSSKLPSSNTPPTPPPKPQRAAQKAFPSVDEGMFQKFEEEYQAAKQELENGLDSMENELAQAEENSNLEEKNPETEKLLQEYEQMKQAYDKMVSQMDSNEPVARTSTVSIDPSKGLSLERLERAINPESYGLTKGEWKELAQFYISHKDQLAAHQDPLFISRHPDRRTGISEQFSESLPRSVGYVSGDVPSQGFHVMLKTHGEMEELGRGSFNLATIDLHIHYNENTGELTLKEGVFRNGAAKHVSEKELEVNTALAPHHQYFAVGTPVHYRGPWRTRRIDVRDGVSKTTVPRANEDIAKVGFFMNRLEGGELFDWVDGGRLTDVREQVRVAAEYAESVAKLHELGYVHRDQKLENSFMTEDGHVKLADFGMARSRGEPCTLAGSPGYMPPEIVSAGGAYRADYSQDIWSMGCVLAGIFDTRWMMLNDNYSERFGASGTITHPQGLEYVKATAFKDRNNPLSVDFLLNKCLELDPSARPSAKDVAAWLRNYHAELEEQYGPYQDNDQG